jgi:hypothetical protein
MCLSCKDNMHFRVYKFKFSCPFLAMLSNHANTCHMSVLQVSYDQICTNMLRDTWFEVFGLKIPFLQVLDCHNSPQQAITRHGEQNGSSGGLVATNSQWRVSGAFWYCLLVLADSVFFVPDLLCSLL